MFSTRAWLREHQHPCTHLFSRDTHVVAFVHVRIYAERAYGAYDDIGGGRTVKRRTWDVDRVIGISEVLSECACGLPGRECQRRDTHGIQFHRRCVV